LDNFNVANIELDDLRKQVGVALQKPFLYAGTIKENISLGQPSAPMREITEVATMAQLDQFLLKTPKGFDSPVTSMGNNLSGGQAARIALARVLLRKPSVLILDEALASLDQSLTGSIFSLLLEKYKKSTCIFVSDYLPLHVQSDQIIVMHEGEIVEQGTYNELVNARAYYYHLLATELEAAK
jgi:ATP-binding cassette subfamily B protein